MERRSTAVLWAKLYAASPYHGHDKIAAQLTIDGHSYVVAAGRQGRPEVGALKGQEPVGAVGGRSDSHNGDGRR